MRLHSMSACIVFVLAQAAGSTALARQSWVDIDDYCWDGGDKESFSCEQNGQVLATANAPRTWDPSWPTPANGNWGTGYTSNVVVDKGLECVSKAIRTIGSDLVLNAAAGCSANVDWDGWWYTGGDYYENGTWQGPDFMQFGNGSYAFGDKMEQGNPWVDQDGGYWWKDQFPGVALNLRVNSIACGCSALVLQPD